MWPLSLPAAEQPCGSPSILGCLSTLPLALSTLSYRGLLFHAPFQPHRSLIPCHPAPAFCISVSSCLPAPRPPPCPVFPSAEPPVAPLPCPSLSLGGWPSEGSFSILVRSSCPQLKRANLPPSARSLACPNPHLRMPLALPRLLLSYLGPCWKLPQLCLTGAQSRTGWPPPARPSASSSSPHSPGPCSAEPGFSLRQSLSAHILSVLEMPPSPPSLAWQEESLSSNPRPLYLHLPTVVTSFCLNSSHSSFKGPALCQPPLHQLL